MDCHGGAAWRPRSAGRGILAGAASAMARCQHRARYSQKRATAADEDGRRRPLVERAIWQMIGHPVLCAQNPAHDRIPLRRIEFFRS